MTFAVCLAIDVPVSVDLGDELFRKRVDARYADTVQTARNLVAVLVEFTAGVQDREHDFESRLALFFVHVGGDTTTVVLDGNRSVLVYCDFYIRTESCKGLVDRVVDHLVYQMVETLFADVADVHCGTFAHGLQTFEDLNA